MRLPKITLKANFRKLTINTLKFQVSPEILWLTQIPKLRTPKSQKSNQNQLRHSFVFKSPKAQMINIVIHCDIRIRLLPQSYLETIKIHNQAKVRNSIFKELGVILKFQLQKIMARATFIFLLIVTIFAFNVDAGPMAYAACQTACNLGWASCYASAGLVAGTVTGGLAAPFAAVACNVAQGICMGACVALLTAPTP